MNFLKKIHSLEELKDKIMNLKALNKRIIHCHGTFDLLHPGHFRHFQEAKKLGDILLVTLTPDRFVIKGEGRPLYTEDLRAECIASLEYVDLVALNDSANAIGLLDVIRPDVYVKGPDYKEHTNDPTGNIGLEVEVVEKNGGKIHYTEDIVFSSTNLIKRYLK